MIHIEHSRLADGMSALAVPQDGDVTITVSRALDPADQRAAVKTAMRAARRAGWLPSRIPGWLLLPLSLGAIPAKVKAIIAGVAALAVSGVVAAAVLTVPPQAAPARVIPVRPPVGTITAHRHRRRPVRARTVRSVSRAGHSTPPLAAGQPSPQVQSGVPLPTVSASVGVSVAPSLSPSPSPSVTVGAGTCVYVLGIKVCLGL